MRKYSDDQLIWIYERSKHPMLRRKIFEAFPKMSKAVLSRCINRGEKLVQAAREEAVARWSGPPKQREPLTQEVVGVCEAITWLSLGKATAPDDMPAIRNEIGTPAYEAAIEWGLGQLRAALIAEKITAVGCMLDDAGNSHRRKKIETEIFHSRLWPIESTNGLCVDPMVFDDGEDPTSFGVEVVRADGPPVSIVQFDRVTFNREDLEKVVQPDEAEAVPAEDEPPPAPITEWGPASLYKDYKALKQESPKAKEKTITENLWARDYRHRQPGRRGRISKEYISSMIREEKRKEKHRLAAYTNGELLEEWKTTDLVLRKLIEIELCERGD